MPHTLNEEEIQKRLYGRYHKGTAPKMESPRLSAEMPQLVIKTSSRSVPWTTQFKTWMIQAASQTGLLLKKFPWKLFSAVTVLLVLAILGFQHIPSWLSKAKPRLNVEEPVSGETLLTRPVQSRKVSESIDSSSVTLTKPEVGAKTTSIPKKRYFVVQICTYQREQDAKQLTNQLRNLNFSAFYLKSSSSRGLLHYVVFLSKNESYAEANLKLEQFRKTSESRRFSDAFIRSL